MERGFLKLIAERYYEKYKDNIRHLTFVFPNRRSAVYFRDHLADLSAKPLWSPGVYSINDLISLCSGLETPETYELVFELYNTYRDQFPEKKISMENFFQNGKIILSDLNEIDKNLADTKSLFRALRGLEGLENPEPCNSTEIKKEYLDLWLDLETIYSPFRRSLESHHSAYEGMAFRKVSENIRMITDRGWDKIIFAGFNALSGSELEILTQLEKAGIAEIINESDPYFAEDPEQEAGMFHRKYNLTLHSESLSYPPGEGLSGEKKIRIVETTSDTAQAKYCGLKLAELFDRDEAPEDIAVVLPDETLLFPILNSLPDNTGKGNISIGYPLRQTSVYSLYESLILLHNNKTRQWTRRDLLKILEHPYIRTISDEELNQLYKEVKKGTGTFVNRPENPSGILGIIGSMNEDSTVFLEKFLSIFDLIRKAVVEERIRLSGIEKEFIHRFYILALKLNEIIRRTGDPVSLRGFHRMFSDLIGSVHIPFTGEPLEGLQILGVLEMQNLKFKHLFILSMNEDQFPKGKHSPTFIPQDVRRSFGLPVSGEREAVFAYHFYRMVSNSDNITLLYSGIKPGSMASERSRFIDQILLEYGEYNKKADIDQISADFSIEIGLPPVITVKKNRESLERIRSMTFSPTSLRTWMECPLRFWFQYILRLREESETEDAHDPAKFGSIVHKVLEKIYNINKNPDRNFYSNLRSEQIEKIIHNAFLDEKIVETETGLNRITFEVIKKFTRKFLTDEEMELPFTINSLENKIEDVVFEFNAQGRKESVKLKGIIDRIDTKENITRIIDYKTGKVEKLEITKEMSEIDFIKHKEVFQLFFYALLLKNNGILDDGFKLGIYPFKTLSDNLSFVKLNGKEIFEISVLAEFKKILSSILEEVFDPEIQFSQTEDEKNCKYCIHKNICERSLNNKNY